MSLILLLFESSSVPGPAEPDGAACAVRHYRLAREQPVPVQRGERPASPYPSLTMLAVMDAQSATRFVTARAPRPPFAAWLYRPIGQKITREDIPCGAPHIHLAFTNPAPGREDDYNRWYDGGHLAHALLADGFASAQRFRLESVVGPGSAPSPCCYLALYDLHTNDLRASEDDMHRYATGAKPGMTLSDALGQIRATWVYSPA